MQTIENSNKKVIGCRNIDFINGLILEDCNIILKQIKESFTKISAFRWNQFKDPYLNLSLHLQGFSKIYINISKIYINISKMNINISKIYIESV